jgi:phytoene dehydrogenase-like protein
MDKAYIDAKSHGWSSAPIVEMLIPSTMDATLAPEGKHVASLFCQQFSPNLADGASWHDHRLTAADTIIETVTKHAPNFRQSILGMMILSPLDLEEKFGLIGGDIMHGQMSLDQMWAARPLMNYGNYRGPLKSLYMCGSGTHPGGGVTGLPGKNAAREILKDG